MRCYYEVLQVERSANDAELKKAYRKLALQWHPDKNAHRTEEAEERFKEIQGAYEVLSNPQERKWYDDHRESILAGHGGLGGEEAGSEIVPDLWGFFRRSAFDGMDDEENGFFQVYGRAFDSIHAAEVRVDNSVETAPAFGRSISSDDEVYDRREAANRMERRAIDKFNKKLRVEAREKYIDLVRNLVAFCKTRDVRYARARQTRQTEREKQKFKQKEESERKRKERVAREEEAREHFEELERARVEQEKLEGKDAFKLAEEEETTQTDEVLFQCEICDKFFKSEKQLANHERSKKHKEKLKKLQHELRRQEALAKKSLASKKEASSPKKQAPAAVEKDPDGDAQSSSSSSEGSDEESDDYLDVFYNPQSRRRYDDELTEEDDDDDDKEEAEENEDDGDNEDGEVPTDTDDVEALKDGEPSGQVDKEHVDKYAGKQGDDEGSQAVDDSHLEEEETNHHDQNEQKETTVDAKFQTSKEANSVQKGNEVLQPGDSSSNKQKPEANETEHKCAICKAGFPSRNQLFKHIKSTGHAELKATTDVPSKRRQQRRKGKKRR